NFRFGLKRLRKAGALGAVERPGEHPFVDYAEVRGNVDVLAELLERLDDLLGLVLITDGGEQALIFRLRRVAFELLRLLEGRRNRITAELVARVIEHSRQESLRGLRINVRQDLVSNAPAGWRMLRILDERLEQIGRQLL